MGPFHRRAALLASALVTTIPGCGSSHTSTPTPPTEPTIARNPPAPQPRPTHDRVIAREGGTCVVSYMDDCPPSGPCDPGPDAEVIACPPSLASADAHRYPPRSISGSAASGCYAFMEEDCPPDVNCNPPPPEDMACPQRYPRPPAPARTRHVSREGDHCVEYVSVTCPEGMSCNPPPPQRVPCPPGI